MKFYDLSETERKQKYAAIENELLAGLEQQIAASLHNYFDDDLYIRKAACLRLGKIYAEHSTLQETAILFLNRLFEEQSEKVRQTVIYACGEIAVTDYAAVRHLLEKGLTDRHHSVRNAVVGSLKKAGDKNPEPILGFCRENIASPDAETRRLACHGLELRGRSHPQEVIGVLKLLQFEKSKQVRDMLIHVLGQISYKKGCFHFVSNEVRSWENKEIYPLYKKEVIEVHGRYEKFSEFSQKFIEDRFLKNE